MTVNVTYPIDALVSYHYFKTDSSMKHVTGPRHLRLIADSGAFSAYTQGAPIKLDEYADWLIRWRSYFQWCAALDVIGDPAATYKNWTTLRDRHQVATVPTLHAGGDPKWLDVYAAEGVDYVGLGGLVGIAKRAFPWMVHVMKYARDNHPEMRFHAWGVTNRKILEALPVYSTDSSGLMGQSYRYGRLRLFNPITGKDTLIVLDGKQAYHHRELLRIYGVVPDQVAKSVPANRPLLGQLMAATSQQYAKWLQRRHKVTPPTWGFGDGTRIHVVCTSTTILSEIAGPRLHMSEQYGDLMALAPDTATAAETATAVK